MNKAIDKRKMSQKEIKFMLKIYLSTETDNIEPEKIYQLAFKMIKCCEEPEKNATSISPCLSVIPAGQNSQITDSLFNLPDSTKKQESKKPIKDKAQKEKNKKSSTHKAKKETVNPKSDNVIRGINLDSKKVGASQNKRNKKEAEKIREISGREIIIEYDGGKGIDFI